MAWQTEAQTWEIILVGEDFKNVPSSIKHFSKSEDAAKWITEHQFTDTTFLIKESRSIEMEKVVDAIKE